MRVGLFLRDRKGPGRKTGRTCHLGGTRKEGRKEGSLGSLLRVRPTIRWESRGWKEKRKGVKGKGSKGTEGGTLCTGEVRGEWLGRLELSFFSPAGGNSKLFNGGGRVKNQVYSQRFGLGVGFDGEARWHEREKRDEKTKGRNWAQM